MNQAMLCVNDTAGKKLSEKEKEKEKKYDTKEIA